MWNIFFDSLSVVPCVEGSIAMCRRELNVPVAFPLGLGPEAGLRLFICSSAGWTWDFAGAVVCEFVTTYLIAGSSQGCPLPLDINSAFKGSENSVFVN